MSAYIKKSYQNSLEEDEDGAKDKSCSVRKVLHFILSKPFNFLRDIMIPISEEGNWNRNYASCAPIAGLIFFLVSTERKLC